MSTTTITNERIAELVTLLEDVAREEERTGAIFRYEEALAEQTYESRPAEIVNYGDGPQVEPARTITGEQRRRAAQSLLREGYDRDLWQRVEAAIEAHCATMDLGEDAVLDEILEELAWSLLPALLVPLATREQREAAALVLAPTPGLVGYVTLGKRGL